MRFHNNHTDMLKINILESQISCCFWGFFLGGGGGFPKVFVIKNETKVSLHKCIKLPLRGGDEPYFYTTYFILQILQM
jgi:hypothetical protein